MKLDVKNTAGAVVFVAITKDRTEGDKVRSLGGWKWHGSTCNPNYCRRDCPAGAVGVQNAWWTTSAEAARKIGGAGVRTPNAEAALGEVLDEPRPSTVLRWDASHLAFVLEDAPREASEQIRGVGGWRWHGGPCTERCSADCQMSGVRGWWTLRAESAKAFATYADDSARAALRRIDEVIAHSRSASDDFDVPSPVGLTYRPYQRAGIRWAMERPRALIADVPGLGKTGQAIGVAMMDKSIKRVLVVCPASVSFNWADEIARWATRKVRVVNTCGKPLGKLLKSDPFASDEDTQLWIITSYDATRPRKATRMVKGEQRQSQPGLGNLLPTVPFDLMVLDEAHRIGNRTASQAIACKSLAKNCRRVIALTGTPIPNEILEMQSCLEILDEKMFSYKQFAGRYCKWENNSFGASPYGLREDRAAELQNLLRSTVMIRRTKEQVLKELPPKLYQTHVLEISPELQQFVADEDEIASLANNDRVRRARALRAIAEATGNRQAMLDAISDEIEATSLLFESASRDRLALGLAKARAVIPHLREMSVERDGKLIVFCWHREVAEEIYSMLGGSAAAILLMGGQDADDRREQVKAFQEEDQIRTAVCTIGGAGEGITLTAGTKTVFLEFPWNPAKLTQAEDRAHRLGQQKTVTIQFVVVDRSLDAFMVDLIASKARIAEQALDTAHAPTATVTLPQAQPAREERFEAHDPTADADKGNGDGSGSKSRSRRRIDDAVSDGRADRILGAKAAVSAEIVPTPSEIASMLACLRSLAGADPDRAKERNEEGFSAGDGPLGHALASLAESDVTPEIWRLGAAMVRRYVRQLGTGAVEASGAKRLG